MVLSQEMKLSDECRSKSRAGVAVGVGKVVVEVQESGGGRRALFAARRAQAPES